MKNSQLKKILKTVSFHFIQSIQVFRCLIHLRLNWNKLRITMTAVHPIQFDRENLTWKLRIEQSTNRYDEEYSTQQRASSTKYQKWATHTHSLSNSCKQKPTHNTHEKAHTYTNVCVSWIFLRHIHIPLRCFFSLIQITRPKETKRLERRDRESEGDPCAVCVCRTLCTKWIQCCIHLCIKINWKAEKEKRTRALCLCSLVVCTYI